MAQKREKEETELKVPQSLPLCTPNPNLPVSSQPASPSRTSSVRTADISDPKISAADDLRSSSGSDLAEQEIKDSRLSVKRPREATRCSGIGCRRKVGLIGIRCRCGEVFCSEHRYSDRHDCTYDYKAAGREAIARENPVVKAAKILKV